MLASQGKSLPIHHSVGAYLSCHFFTESNSDWETVPTPSNPYENISGCASLRRCEHRTQVDENFAYKNSEMRTSEKKY